MISVVIAIDYQSYASSRSKSAIGATLHQIEGGLVLAMWVLYRPLELTLTC